MPADFGYDTYNTEWLSFYHPQSFYITAGSEVHRIITGENIQDITILLLQQLKGKLENFNLRLMGGTMWQDYETEMFAVYGTNIVDSVGGCNTAGNGKMYKDGKWQY